MPRIFWWPNTLAAQVLLLQNVVAKIATYQIALGWKPAQVTDAIALCNAILTAIGVTDQCRLAMKAATTWRDVVLYGEPKGKPGPTPPVFPVIDGSADTCGLVDQFFDLRDQIVANAGYTINMGEDLGLVGPEHTGKPADEITPALKTISTSKNFVTITGSMQGLPAMRVEYAAKGQTYGSVAVITNLPATIQIPMDKPDVPQVGTIRSIFVKKNADFGNYSPNYDVTLA